MNALTLTLTAPEKDLEAWAIAFLKSRDFSISKNRDWLPIREYAKSRGVCFQTVSRRLKDPRCPEVATGYTSNGAGRVRIIAPNAAFDRFLGNIQDHPLPPVGSATNTK